PTTINSMNITSVRAVAGVAARYTHELDNGSRFLPEGYVRALQELADPGQPISGSVVGGGTFISSPTKRDKFSTGLGAGFTYEFTDVFSVRLLYDGEFQDDYREDSVTAAVRLEF
ncbi:autotransporter outer membrane beta-barrel domain-containing protein, partial [Pyruvatibacter sp.]|uniref:autotransporter outer membrane beta-barrel domain-containing protein n=1 Tax=Pyruvatibacter sp. TaxID=1981328 RepID=UPI0032ECB71B